jgi:hypothetical protein
MVGEVWKLPGYGIYPALAFVHATQIDHSQPGVHLLTCGQPAFDVVRGWPLFAPLAKQSISHTSQRVDSTLHWIKPLSAYPYTSVPHWPAKPELNSFVARVYREPEANSPVNMVEKPRMSGFACKVAREPQCGSLVIIHGTAGATRNIAAICSAVSAAALGSAAMAASSSACRLAAAASAAALDALMSANI